MDTETTPHRVRRGMWRLLQPQRFLEPVVAVVLLMALALQILLGSMQAGLAYDERFHIPAGVTYVATGVRRMALDHTPLGHLLTGAALQPLAPEFDRLQYAALAAHPQDASAVIASFWSANRPRQALILLVGRIPFMALGLVAALYVYLLSRSMWGSWPGLLSLAFCSFCPGLVAWSRFVYMDAPLAAFSIACLAHLWWYLRSRGPTQLALLAAATACTLGTKYSGLFVLPLITGLLLVPGEWLGLDHAPWKRRCADLGVLMVGVAALLWAIYGFATDPLFFFRGMGKLYGSVSPTYPFYLGGRFQPGGFWDYFLVTFLIKSTLPTLVCTAAVVGCFALSTTRWLRGGDERRDQARAMAVRLGLTLGSAFLFFLLTTWKALPLGFRYLLPVYPLLYVAFGGLGKLAMEQGARLPRVLMAGLTLLHLASSLRTHPDQMAYFHELVGGPEQGVLWVNDASLDAGQNLPRLAAYLRARGNPVVKLGNFGMDVPEHYGIRWRPVPQAEWDCTPLPGLYVLSTQALIYGQLEARSRAHQDWLKKYQPIATIGGSYFIYEF